MYDREARAEPRDALWARSTKNLDESTGSLARPFARSLPPLTHLLALHCSLCSRAPLPSFVRFAGALRCPHSFACSLAHSLASSRESERLTFQNKADRKHSAMSISSSTLRGILLSNAFRYIMRDCGNVSTIFFGCGGDGQNQ